MLINKSSNEAAVEAALCLGFLRPCSNTAQEYLLQCLSQGSKTQQMKALRMLVKMMHINTATVIRAILDQLCHSSVLEHRFEATQMLKTIGLQQIRAQGLEGSTFDLLWKKTYNEPFLVRSTFPNPGSPNPPPLPSLKTSHHTAPQSFILTLRHQHTPFL